MIDASLARSRSPGCSYEADVAAFSLAGSDPPLTESLDRFGLKSRGFGGCALDCLLDPTSGCLHVGNTGRMAVRSIDGFVLPLEGCGRNGQGSSKARIGFMVWRPQCGCVALLSNKTRTSLLEIVFIVNTCRQGSLDLSYRARNGRPVQHQTRWENHPNSAPASFELGGLHRAANGKVLLSVQDIKYTPSQRANSFQSLPSFGRRAPGSASTMPLVLWLSSVATTAVLRSVCESSPATLLFSPTSSASFSTAELVLSQSGPASSSGSCSIIWSH